jgi:hypothetical protein
MPDPGHTLTKNSVRTIARSVRHTARQSRETYNVTPNTGVMGRETEIAVWPARCTGLAPGGAEGLSGEWGLCPGKVWLPKAAQPAGENPWQEIDCWLRPIPDRPYEEGQAGLAKLVGFRPEGDGHDAMPVYCFVAGGSASNGGCDGTGWAWVAGLLTGECLKLTVAAASGLCDDIDTNQTFTMRWEADRISAGVGAWVSKKWDAGTSAWVDANFNDDAALGPVLFWIDEGRPRMKLETADYELMLDCGSSTNKVITFRGGTEAVCGGTAPALPAGACADNTFTVKLECVCCPIQDFEEGWYGVVGAGEDCEEDEVAVVELLEEDKCDFNGIICCGPHATEEEANAACLGIPPPTCTDRDPSTLPATLDWIASAPSGDGACADGAFGIMEEGEYGQGPDAWATPSVEPCAGDPESFALDLRLACGSGQYALSGSTSTGNCSGLTGPILPVSGTATPFKLVFHIPACWWKGDADPAHIIKITITE